MYHNDEAKKISADLREQIYKEIWTEPVSKVAPRYGISDTAFRKRCVECWDIPVPEAGYWAKKRAGKIVYQPKLHKYPSDEARRYIYGYAVTYKDLSTVPMEALYTDEPLYAFSEKTISLLTKIAGRNNICDNHSKVSKTIKDGYKKWVQENKTPEWSARGICILNSLTQEIRDLEGYSGIDLEDKGRSIAGDVLVCRQNFAFLIYPDDNKPQQLSMAFQWKQWWGSYKKGEPNDLLFTDLPEKSLESQLGTIIYEIFVLAGKHLQEKEIEQREEKRRQEELAFQRKIAPLVEEENKKVGKALEDAENYKKACEIRTYAEAYFNKNGAQFDEHPEYRTYYDWLIARADWIDPLIENDYEALLERLQKK